jgi:hypothetical protein
MKTSSFTRCVMHIAALSALLVLLNPLAAKAQKVELDDMFGVSVGGGYTFSHTDFKWTKTIPSPVFYAGIHYFSLNFLSINLDFQKGLLKGGAALNAADKTETGFENSYFAGAITFRFFPIALAGDDAKADGLVKALATLYGGTGVGLLFNNVDANNIPNLTFGSQKDISLSNMFIPLEIGANIPVAKIGAGGQLMINVNFRTNLCFSDKIDGYEPTLDANKHNDAFSTLTGGVVYKFGL